LCICALFRSAARRRLSISSSLTIGKSNKHDWFITEKYATLLVNRIHDRVEGTYHFDAAAEPTPAPGTQIDAVPYPTPFPWFIQSAKVKNLYNLIRLQLRLQQGK
jgi:hypothetical protein